MAYNSNSNIKQTSKVYYKKCLKDFPFFQMFFKYILDVFCTLALFEYFRMIHAINH